MKKVLFIAAAALVGTTAMASAHSVDGTQAWQAKRIEQGRKSGKITWTEGLKLRAEQRKIRRKEAQFRSDGYLSKSEHRKLRTMQQKASKHIRQEKHDGHKRVKWLPRVGY
jgi:hypothetical protein